MQKNEQNHLELYFKYYYERKYLLNKGKNVLLQLKFKLQIPEKKL